MNLDRYWQEAWHGLGLRPPEGVHDMLLARYGERHRSYHTLHHLEECFPHFETVRHLCARPVEVLLALWFHDAVYDPHRHDNEARSAALARTCLLEAGAEESVIGRIERSILATAHTSVFPATDEATEASEISDCTLVSDIDLAILGAAPRRFAEYERQIRQEYAWVPEAEYRRGRKAVLQHFADRPAIYVTPVLRARLEIPARGNLTAALRTLSVSLSAK